MDLSLKRAFPFETEKQEPLNKSSRQPTLSGETLNLEAGLDTCFGSIIDIEAQLCSKEFLSSCDQAFKNPGYPILVVQTGNYFTLEHNGQKLARLSKGLCRILHQAVTGRQVSIRAFIRENWDGDQTSTILPIEINIYGIRANSEDIGRVLSKSGVFLQLPRYLLNSVEYHNPHILQIEGYVEQDRVEAVLPSATPAADLANLRTESESVVNDSTTMINHILDSLSHHVLLRQLPADCRIRSTLLPHQREAIDFILQRETSSLPSELSLWKYNDLDGDKPFYQHIFSGAKRPQQEETKGGIVADEMGLGKSLVMLSTVAGSLDRAEDFFSSQIQLFSNKSAKKAPSKATLIVAPSSLLIDNWIHEIRRHTYSGGLTFYRYLGPGRHTETDFLHKRAIVFTTYATLATDFCSGKNALADINWFRIVLDEAHNIRNRSTKQFQAVASLSSHHHWCLTGTPIQNKLDDLGALVSFVQVPILKNPASFQKFIINPIVSGSGTRYENLRVLLRSICIRRTRELLNLPDPVSEIRRVKFTAAEYSEYNKILLQCRTDLDMMVSGRLKGASNKFLLDTLMKLRLYCNNGSTNPILQSGSTGLPADPDEALTYLQQQEENVCSYCNGIIFYISETAETDGGRFISSCCHLVCGNCEPGHRASKERCPACASEGGNKMTLLNTPSSTGRQMQSHAGSENNSFDRPESYPSKLRELLSDIRIFSTEKSIVFSCWKKTLSLVSQLLHTHGIKYNMIYGSLSLNKRIEVLNDFRSPSGANILLMTLGTGAVGLNLAVASRIYLLEPQWNPYIESQAIGRALRLGQTARVTIVRYVVIDTIEESNILGRQRKKLQLVDGGFGKDKDMISERLRPLLNMVETHYGDQVN
ncbi:DNA repair and recombination protein RAD5C [Metarhizium robertsii ARSEF 23]|uniref:DNA repair and recombination protein RAD5C n=1 Tax=Metarhizium robertsii (strain ARSEF 23 / ATCC MYA-3075) TaxID=655844 RepID=E9F226_METRA|nr:DNA repair and recombination protein RAD5C [Metarhizium robertsii ARSEF 23]EFY98115.2 DNA repair and recombination protein RAD5C [Metarhizium robertsii ARSEF 23]